MHFNRDSFIFTRILPPPVTFTYSFVPLRIACKTNRNREPSPFSDTFSLGNTVQFLHLKLDISHHVHEYRFPPLLSGIIQVFARANKHRRCASGMGDLLAHFDGKQWGDSGNSVGQPREGRRNGICGGWVLKCWIPLSKLKPITTKHSLLFGTFQKNKVRPILPCVSEANILPKAMGAIFWRLVWFVERSTYRVSGMGCRFQFIMKTLTWLRGREKNEGNYWT